MSADVIATIGLFIGTIVWSIALGWALARQ